LARAFDKAARREPMAGTGSGQGTFPSGSDAVSPSGAIVGDYLDASNVYHGVVRVPSGVITIFDVPGAGTSSGQGTFAGPANPAGAITGYYLDASFIGHGFLRIP